MFHSLSFYTKIQVPTVDDYLYTIPHLTSHIFIRFELSFFAKLEKSLVSEYNNMKLSFCKRFNNEKKFLPPLIVTGFFNDEAV